jgi:hypothetical protein
MAFGGYTGVVLHQTERRKLLEYFHVMAPFLQAHGYKTNWMGRMYAHHMTMNMGFCRKPEVRGYHAELTLDAWGITDKVMAVRVSGWSPHIVWCENSTPHITICVHTDRGKPRHSNDIKEWIPMVSPMTVRGIIQEVY